MNGVLSTIKNAGLISPYSPTDNYQGIKLTRVSQKDISPTCSYPSSTPLDCAAGERGAVEKHVYESGLIDFDGIAPPTDANTPIRFTWEQNARNDSENILIINSMTLISNMYPFYPNGSTSAKPISSCFDNAPTFTESPASLLYTSGQDFIFNNNAIDLDLDNLYYDFIKKHKKELYLK